MLHPPIASIFAQIEQREGNERVVFGRQCNNVVHHTHLGDICGVCLCLCVFVSESTSVSEWDKEFDVRLIHVRDNLYTSLSFNTCSLRRAQ